MLAKIREDQQREQGFTLIELLVVVIIIGILAAIAIPVFLNQREKAYLKAAQSDARNAAIAIETYFTEKQAYPGANVWTAGAHDLGTGDKVTVSTAVTLDYDPVGTPATSYCIVASHDSLDASKDVYYDSANGGIVAGTATACDGTP